MQPAPSVCSLVMSQRRIFHAVAGAYLASVRKKRRLTQTGAARVAKAKKLAGVTRQSLRGIEGGLTKNPSPELLRSLATLYGEDYDSLVKRFVGYRYETMKAPGTAEVGPTPASTPVQFDPTERRLLRLWRQITSRKDQEIILTLTRRCAEKPLPARALTTQADASVLELRQKVNRLQRPKIAPDARRRPSVVAHPGAVRAGSDLTRTELAPVVDRLVDLRVLDAAAHSTHRHRKSS
jgi:transcriptional regulator with XRE-family HTH domain